jgi:DNA transformation protein and related proteins
MFAKSSSGGNEGERRDPADDLETMKNLGPVSAARLREVGIETAHDLRLLGAVEAYRRLKRAYPIETTQVALYALHGAINDVHWYSLSDEAKARLREEANG